MTVTDDAPIAADELAAALPPEWPDATIREQVRTRLAESGEVVVVLDDDPTGTQSATGVRVLLRWDTDRLTAALSQVDAVYLQTNSRAIDEAAAVALCRRIREEIDIAAARLGEPVQVVLRGDSTLRGHVFAETDVFVTD